MRVLLLSLVLLLVPAAARGQDVPPVLASGFAAYASGGYNAALDAWFAGWDAEDVDPLKPQFERVFQQMETQAGKFVGSDIVGTVPWGTRGMRVYALVMYQERPLYAFFDLYQSTGDWRVLGITVNTDVSVVFPPGLLIPPAR